jgi:glycosyltransferase involved in cell wall biosynthesis
MDRGVWIHRRPQIRVKGSSRLLGRIFPDAIPRIMTATSTFVQHRRLGVRFDVIEAPDWMAEGLFLTRATPVVAHLHTPVHVVARHRGRPPGRGLGIADRLERASVRRAAIVSSPSRMLSEHLLRSGWLDGKRVRLVRNPIDLKRWSSCPPADGTGPVVLSVGRVEARKSPETLVEAAARLVPEVPGLEVVYVGRSNGERAGQPYRDWVQSRARRMGSPCRFVESVPRDELQGWYERARIVVVSSTFDNFPMAGLEAMAAGRAVVCTSETGLAEIVTPTAGSVVRPGDPEGLAAALRPYLADQTLAARAGRAARAIVAEQCAPEVVAEAREQCYVAAIERWRSAKGGPR